MKVALIVVSALIGVCVAAPAKLDNLLLPPTRRGYDYKPPPQPVNLYEPPAPRTTTTTTTTTTRPPPPPPPPPGDYLPPVPSNQILVRETTTTPPPTTKGMGMLMPYNFEYGIEDSDSGNQYSHRVDSDGQYVTGQYSVLLPDGRTQIVKFTSNPFDGYVAEVIYV